MSKPIRDNEVQSRKGLFSGGFGVFLAGTAVGFIATLLLDPVSGRRRRSYIADKVVRYKNDARWSASKEARDLSHRAQGMMAKASHAFQSEQSVDDATLVERVRSEMGRKVRHPRSIDVSARNGEITLRGLILASEVESLLGCVRDVSGVKHVVNELEVHDSPENIPGLQGNGKASLRDQS